MTVELDLALGQGQGDGLRDGGPALQDILEAGAVEAVAAHVGHRHHGGGARLPGHQRHLAQEGAGLQARHALEILASGGVHAHVRLPGEDDEEPVLDGPFAGDGLAFGEGSGLEAPRERPDLLVGEAGEDVHPAQGGQASFELQAAAALLHVGVLLGHHDGAVGDGDLDAGAGQGVIDAHAHLGGHGLGPGQVPQPVARRVDRVPLREVHEHAPGRRVRGHARGRVRAQDLLHGGDDLVGLAVVIDVEVHLQEPLRREPPGAAQDRHRPLHDAAVGDDDDVAHAGVQGGLPPADLPDQPFLVADADPVARREGALQVQDHAADDVAQRVLQGEGHHGRDHGRGGQEAGEVGPLVAGHAQGRADVEHGQDQVAQDGREPQAQRRQDDAEGRGRGRVDGGQGQQQDGQAVRDAVEAGIRLQAEIAQDRGQEQARDGGQGQEPGRAQPAPGLRGRRRQQGDGRQQERVGQQQGGREDGGQGFAQRHIGILAKSGTWF